MVSSSSFHWICLEAIQCISHNLCLSYAVCHMLSLPSAIYYEASIMMSLISQVKFLGSLLPPPFCPPPLYRQKVFQKGSKIPQKCNNKKMGQKVTIRWELEHVKRFSVSIALKICAMNLHGKISLQIHDDLIFFAPLVFGAM